MTQPSTSAYIRGVTWFVLVSLISATNDFITKGVGLALNPSQVAFFRFLFSTLTLIPFMLIQGKKSFETAHYGVHGVRGLLLFLAIAPWCYGVVSMPLTLATTISFTTPFFVLILSSLFLSERVGMERSLATFIGFIGIVTSTNPASSGFDWTALLLVLSTCMFATLDVINKKLLIKDEAMLPMLFYSALVPTILSAPFALASWTTPALNDLCLLLVLGGGANLILYCLLRAFSYCELSSLQPFRYVELLISGGLGWTFFHEIPSSSTLMGACFIIPATLYIVYYETRKRKKKTSNHKEENSKSA